MNARIDPMVSGEPVNLARPRYETVVARTLEDLMQVMMIRSLVYVGEQKCPYDEEYDGNDFSGATHLILRRGKEPIGTLRIRWFADFAKLERVAVRSEFRGTRATLELVREAFRIAERKGYRRILGHAQARLLPFWGRHFKGFPRESRETFVFSDHDYVEIVAETTPPPNALTIDSDPMILLRPEGDWDTPGVLDWSADRPATNPPGEFMKPFGRDSFVPAPALLCLDLQRDQAEGAGLSAEDAGRCVEECRRVLGHARRAGWQVAHVHRHKGAAACLSEPSPPIVGLEPLPREAVFYRDRPSAFSSMPFRDFVSRLGDPRLIVIGFSLDASVLFTAVGGHEAGVPITVVQGALAAPSLRGFGGEVIETVLLSVLGSFVEVLSADQLLRVTGPLLAQAANHP